MNIIFVYKIITHQCLSHIKIELITTTHTQEHSTQVMLVAVTHTRSCSNANKCFTLSVVISLLCIIAGSVLLHSKMQPIYCNYSKISSDCRYICKNEHHTTICDTQFYLNNKQDCVISTRELTMYYVSSQLKNHTAHAACPMLYPKDDGTTFGLGLVFFGSIILTALICVSLDNQFGLSKWFWSFITCCCQSHVEQKVTEYFVFRVTVRRVTPDEPTIEEPVMNTEYTVDNEFQKKYDEETTQVIV